MKLIEYQNPYWKDNNEYFLELLHLVKKFSYNGAYVHMLKANDKRRNSNATPKYQHLRSWIESITHQYDSQILDFKSRIYWILYGLVNAPKCLNESCKNKFINKKFGATKKNQPCFCSIQCLNKSHFHISYMKQTIHCHINEDERYWNDVEKKRKKSKIKSDHSANWNNSSKYKIELYFERKFYKCTI